MSQSFNPIADWVMFRNPLYMARIVQSRTRNGISLVVEEADKNQSRQWFAFNFVDEFNDVEGINKLTHRVLLGRHKLLSKHNQLKYAEDFYASLNNDKVKKLMGPEFSSIGGQWIQVNGFEDIGANYAWLVLSPWGKIWISRLAILCLAVDTTDNFTTSDILDHSAISFSDLPHPMQTLASSSRQINRQGDSTILDNDTIVSSYNPSRKFKSDTAERDTEQTFKYLYGLEKYAAVRGDQLWDSDLIGKSLGRTALTGVITMALGGGYWGFGTAAVSQLVGRKQYLDAGIPEKIKQQSQDLYDQAMSITQIVSRLNNPQMTFVADKLREATDDFRKTIPVRFLGKDYEDKSLYRGTADELRTRYKNIFAQATEPIKSNESKEMLGISKPDDTSIIDINRWPETAFLGIKSHLSRNKGNKPRPTAWLAGAAPMLSNVAEKYWTTYNPFGPTVTLQNQVKNMREILGEIRVLAREHDTTNNTQLYEEVKNATNLVNSFLSRILSGIAETSKPSELSTNSNLGDMTGSEKVYDNH